MNIRRKIILTYLCLTILALGVGLFMLQVSRHIAHSLTHNEKHFQKIILASTEAVNFSKRAEGHLMLFLTLGSNEDRKKFPQRCTSLQQQIDTLKHTVAVEEAKTILARLAAKASDIRPAGDAILAAYDKDLGSKGSFTPTEHHQAIADFCALTANVRSLAEELTIFEIELDSRVQTTASARAEALQRYALASLLIGAVLITVGGILVVRRIFRPIDRLTVALSEIHKHSAETTSPLPVESHDEVGSLTASFNRMLEMRQHSEERFRQLFNLSNDAIMVCAFNGNSAGRFIEVNDIACTRLGYTRNEFAQLSLPDLCPPDKLPEVATSLGNIPENTRLMLEMEQLTKTGQRITVEISIHRISLRGQACVLTVSRDITQRRDLEHQLRHSQKMEAVGQLAGGVAHDFNNIIAGNLLYIDLLLHNGGLPKDVQNALTELKNNEQRAANLTRQLLMFGRRQFLQVSTFNLVDVLTRMVAMVGRVIGEQIHLNFKAHQPTLWIHADAGMMEQVVMNLCINARDAMPRGGSLSLIVSEIEIAAGSIVARPAVLPGRYACLKVEDTGCGMTPQVLNRIFEPFFTTKEIGRGSGLGLPTVYGIVQQHGGWIDVESVVGKGSIFTVFVPATATPAETIASRKDNTPSLFSGRETILLVEDEQIVRRSLALSLRSMGYQIIEASTPLEALGKWQREDGKIDLLVTDMIMPGGTSGLELAKNLRDEKPTLRVLITSGYSLDLQNSEMLTRLRFSFLPKPFEMATLALTVKKCLTQSVGSASPFPIKKPKQ